MSEHESEIDYYIGQGACLFNNNVHLLNFNYKALKLTRIIPQYIYWNLIIGAAKSTKKHTLPDRWYTRPQNK